MIHAGQSKLEWVKLSSTAVVGVVAGHQKRHVTKKGVHCRFDQESLKGLPGGGKLTQIESPHINQSTTPQKYNIHTKQTYNMGDSYAATYMSISWVYNTRVIILFSIPKLLDLAQAQAPITVV